jgi:hypothetical protein
MVPADDERLDEMVADMGNTAIGKLYLAKKAELNPPTRRSLRARHA